MVGTMLMTSHASHLYNIIIKDNINLVLIFGFLKSLHVFIFLNTCTQSN